MNEDCLKLTTYFGERDRSSGHLLADELLNLYGHHQLQASILLRGAEGFGRLHHRHTDRLLTLSEDLPVVSIVVDSAARIEALLEPVLAIKRRGLITLERTRLLIGELGEVRLPDQLGEATKLTVYLGRYERAAGRSAFVAVCELLYRRGIAGATVLLGVDGTRRGRRTRARVLRAQHRCPDDDHRGRSAGHGFAAVAARAGPAARRSADHVRARPGLQARRCAARPATRPPRT